MGTYSKLPFDVIYHICLAVQDSNHKSLCNLSEVDRRTRLACIPLLFEGMVFDPQWGERAIPWDGFPEMIEDIIGNSVILNTVRSFHFQPGVRNAKDWPIPTSFFKLLFALPNLRHLALLLQDDYRHQVKCEFGLTDEEPIPTTRRKSLSTLNSLMIMSPEWIFLSDCSPNLKTLDVVQSSPCDWDSPQALDIDMAQLGRQHPDLKEFHCSVTGIDKNIKEIATSLPSIQILGLYGSGYSEPNGILASRLGFMADKATYCQKRTTCTPTRTSNT
ncbi:hypothetical protein M408DRAFT_23777 [Serendipita vermifera MAFF 305830]|uniref:Uncharacterized protein n=1 Tax=Serendipita vermifera MAFF 305830 TaxID=933852 RepID=A0A0C3AV13_SERVB|nr:hypothetical protein M408DRAFT_23777 [Serendipita vermifera MAFF 305830]